MKVTVPATTANLGAGFDCVGVALGWYDEIELEISGEGMRIEVTGEGADQVPRDENNLVVSSLIRGLKLWGRGKLPGLRLRAHNTIPHARGLGSSAAAIVAGLSFAWALTHDGKLDLAEISRVACTVEGHADNAAAAAYGGATLGWLSDNGEVLIDEIALSPELYAFVWVPRYEVTTRSARAALPSVVSRLDAVFQAATAARLVLALAKPDRLFAATQDRLHQTHRAELMPESFELLGLLRASRVPAAISGAGPTVVALGSSAELGGIAQVEYPGFLMRKLAIGLGVSLQR